MYSHIYIYITGLDALNLLNTFFKSFFASEYNFESFSFAEFTQAFGIANRSANLSMAALKVTKRKPYRLQYCERN